MRTSSGYRSLGAAVSLLAITHLWVGCDSGASSSADGGAGTGAAGPSTGGSAGADTSNAAGGSSSGTAGRGANGPVGGAGGDSAPSGGGAPSFAGEAATATGGTGACEHPPQIMYVVSRSGTMFTGQPEPWVLVREAVLPALEKVEGLAELGFLAISGEAATCPTLQEIAPAPSNQKAIATLYASLAEPLKGESPFMFGLDRAGELLTGAGKKYIVFVLNGEADYCSDGDPLCPTDSVIAHIQKLHAAGVTTLVVSAMSPLVLEEQREVAYEAALKAYANAGVGLPVASSEATNNLNVICSSGSGNGAWRKELEMSGKADTATLAEYSATPGGATYLDLEKSAPNGLTAAFTTLLEGIARCE